MEAAKAMMTCHQDCIISNHIINDLPSMFTMAYHHCGQPSLWSAITVVNHHCGHCGKPSKWSTITVVNHHCPRLSAGLVCIDQFAKQEALSSFLLPSFLLPHPPSVLIPPREATSSFLLPSFLILPPSSFPTYLNLRERYVPCQAL